MSKKKRFQGLRHWYLKDEDAYLILILDRKGDQRVSLRVDNKNKVHFE